MRKIIIIAAACLALAGCKTAAESLKEAGNKPLTSSEIKQALAGKTTNGTSTRGFSFQVKYNANGTAALSSNKYNETGKWWTEGENLFCTQWPTIRDGKKGCRHLYNTDGTYRNIRLDGSAASTFTVQ